MHKVKYMYHNLCHAGNCTKLKGRCYLYEMQWNMIFFLITINFDEMFKFLYENRAVEVERVQNGNFSVFIVSRVNWGEEQRANQRSFYLGTNESTRTSICSRHPWRIPTSSVNSSLRCFASADGNQPWGHQINYVKRSSVTNVNDYRDLLCSHTKVTKCALIHDSSAVPI